MTFRKAVSAPLRQPIPADLALLLAKLDEPQRGESEARPDTALAAKSVPVPRGSDN